MISKKNNMGPWLYRFQKCVFLEFEVLEKYVWRFTLGQLLVVNLTIAGLGIEKVRLEDF